MCHAVISCCHFIRTSFILRVTGRFTRQFPSTVLFRYLPFTFRRTPLHFHERAALTEELLEEEEMIVDGVRPILACVSAGTGGEVVVDAKPEQAFVQVFVHLEEEVRLAAVERYPQIAVLYASQLPHDSVLVPRLLVGGHLAQHIRNVPVLRERSYVHSAAHAAAGSEHVLVAHGEEQRTVSAHAQTGNGTSSREGTVL